MATYEGSPTDGGDVTDSDGDEIEDAADNCPDNANANQADADGDGIGDACDSDNGGNSDGSTVDAGTLDNKIMAGYQGWFNADGDGAGRGWRHWSGGKPNADNITIDMWPDLREYDADELYGTDFKYSNGSTAGLYSAYTPKTVERHLKWMQDYGIDGVFVQRFIGEATGSFRGVRDRVLQNVRAGAEKYGRVFANMYDISGGDSGSLVDDIKNDWKHLVDDLRITESSRYLHHNGLPVLSIWGFNVSGRPGSASQARELIRWLTTDAPAKYRATVKLGVDDDWRGDSADWQEAYRSADIISPWAVGRYGDNSGADSFRNNKIEPDLADLKGENIDFMPVVFPGFSWWNLKGEKYNHIKRNGGRFLWRQFYNAIDAGCNMVYVAMFDEVDEATAIYKVTENDSQTPTTCQFVTLDEDGENLPSDWYLRLTGEATKMLRNQIGLTSTIPINPADTYVPGDIDNCPNDPNKTEPGECGCGVPEGNCGVTDADGDNVEDSIDNCPDNANTNQADADSDGLGDVCDPLTDSDDDGMSDDWETRNGLDPESDDAAADPDEDGISNLDEYLAGTDPAVYDGNDEPDAPLLYAPVTHETVSLTPELQTEDFYDPDSGDTHRQSQWQIIREADQTIVLDITSDSALTVLSVPKMILDEDNVYVWQARFYDNHGAKSQWSETAAFTTDLQSADTDGNGVPDDQEVGALLDLDGDGTADVDQADIKCVSMADEDDEAQICISVKDAQNAEAIVSLEVQDPADLELNSATNGKPNYFEFGLLDFKILVTNPGDETTLTIYLSRPAYVESNIFKYDPVNDIWMDYSGYVEFSDSRQEVILTLKDGGFGDADGIENGIIVDPLAFGSETDPSGGGSGSSLIEDVVDGILPSDLSCFITAAATGLNDPGPQSLWHEIRGRELLLLCIVVMLGFAAKAVFTGANRNRKLF
jgi:hypothetical protein